MSNIDKFGPGLTMREAIESRKKIDNDSKIKKSEYIKLVSNNIIEDIKHKLAHDTDNNLFEMQHTIKRKIDTEYIYCGDIADYISKVIDSENISISYSDDFVKHDDYVNKTRKCRFYASCNFAPKDSH